MDSLRNNSPPPDNRHNTTPAPTENQHTAAITAQASGEAPREPNELENGLASEAAQLDDEQTDLLTILLRKLREEGIPLNAATAAGCISGAQTTVACLERQAKKDEALQEQHRHRDSLPEPERIEYVVDTLRKFLGCAVGVYRISVRKILGEQVAPADREGLGETFDENGGTVDAIVRSFQQHLEGTTPEFQRKVLEHYRENVLPGKAAEEAAEDAMQKAIDELLDDGLEGMPAGQIRALTKQLKAESEANEAKEKAHDEFAQSLHGKSAEEIRAMTQQLQAETGDTNKAEPNWGRITWLVDWLRSRSIETKIAALYMQNLIRCDCCLPGETVGNTLYDEFKADVFDGDIPPELGRQAGFLLGLEYMEI